MVNLCVQVVAAETLCKDTQATTAGQMQSVITIDVAQLLPKVDTRHAEVDLHTHLLSSSSTRSPRHVQLTLPSDVSRQRSPQPPFMWRQGDSSPFDDSQARVVTGCDTV